jgi:hypothetical protein
MNSQLKSSTQRFVSITFAIAALSIAGCSSSEKATDPATPEFADKGPTVLNVVTQPGVVELDQNFQPAQRTMITADIKDFNHEVTDVRLRFREIPLELPMIKVGGTTWRAELSANQLQQLAISGKTVRYTADVMAWNDQGDSNQSERPISVSVKGPDIAPVESTG